MVNDFDSPAIPPQREAPPPFSGAPLRSKAAPPQAPQSSATFDGHMLPPPPLPKRASPVGQFDPDAWARSSAPDPDATAADPPTTRDSAMGGLVMPTRPRRASAMGRLARAARPVSQVDAASDFVAGHVLSGVRSASRSRSRSLARSGGDPGYEAEELWASSSEAKPNEPWTPMVPMQVLSSDLRAPRTPPEEAPCEGQKRVRATATKSAPLLPSAPKAVPRNSRELQQYRDMQRASAAAVPKNNGVLVMRGPPVAAPRKYSRTGIQSKAGPGDLQAGSCMAAPVETDAVNADSPAQWSWGQASTDEAAEADRSIPSTSWSSWNNY